jgi:prepilin-type N-terminal cleavage/methylation domain-containing protein
MLMQVIQVVKKYKNGFSLVELSVSLIIIAALALVILSGTGIKKTARISGAKTMTTAANLSSFGDLILWLDAVNMDNLIVETDGTVSSWNDISSPLSDISLEQPTQSARPIYTEDIINGLPAVRFDGTNDVLQELGKNSLLINDDFTTFIVYASNHTRVYGVLLGHVSCEPTRVGYAITDRNTPGLIENYLFPTYGAFGTTSTPSSDGYIVVYKHDGGTHTIQQNESVSSTTIGFSSPVEGDVYIGAGKELSGSCNTQFFADADIGEVIMFKRALTAHEISGIINYLSKKWKIGMTYLGS